MGLDDVACFAYLPLRHALNTRLKPKISSSTDPIISDAGASEAAAIPPCVEDLNYGCYLSVSSDGLVGSDMYVTLGRSVAVADGSGSFSEYSTTDAMNISPFTTLQPFCCTDSMAATIVVNRFLCHLKKTAFECADEFFVLWRKGLVVFPMNHLLKITSVLFELVVCTVVPEASLTSVKLQKRDR